MVEIEVEQLFVLLLVVCSVLLLFVCASKIIPLHLAGRCDHVACRLFSRCWPLSNQRVFFLGARSLG
jgi:hypothetical protein